MMQIRIEILTYIIFLIFLVTCWASCEKWDLDEAEFPELTTGMALNEPGSPINSIKLTGEIKGLLPNGIVEQPGHVYSQTELQPNLDNSLHKSFADQLGNGNYEVQLFDLTPGQTYYYRAYAFYDNQAIYATETRSFTLGEITPLIKVDSVFQISTGTIVSTVRVAGAIAGFSDGVILNDYGVVWSRAEEPTLEDGSIASQGSLNIGNNEVLINASLSIADPGKFYVRSFATVGDKTYYSLESVCFFIGDVWKPGVHFPGPELESGVAFTLDGKGYLGTGRQDDPVMSSLNEFWQYDPENNVWKPKRPFPGEARDDAVGFAIETPTFKRGYIGTGIEEETNAYSDFYEYDPEMDTWREVAALPVPSGLDDGIAFSINGKGYFGIAMDGDDPVNNFYEYDPLDGPLGSWKEVEPFPGPLRGDAVAFVIDDIGYVTSGENGEPFSDLWAFDPSLGPDGEWTIQESIPEEFAREDAVGFAVGGKGYLCTGWNRDEVLFFNDLWEFDPLEAQGNRWQKRKDFPGTERLSAVAFSIGEKAYLGTGFNGTFFNDFWEYTPLLDCE